MLICAFLLVAFDYAFTGNVLWFIVGGCVCLSLDFPVLLLYCGSVICGGLFVILVWVTSLVVLNSCI